MNKKIMLVTAILGASLTACNDSGKESYTQEVDDTPRPISYEYTENNLREENQFTFKEFDLEVDYVDRISYEIEFHQSKNTIKATINDLDQQKVTGQEAYNQLSPLFQEMSFDEDSSEEEVIQDVLDVLDLDQTYKEFELDVTYKNGIEKEYED
ncbi:YusW family protein [Halobacillus mangrovi]|uniref:YusW family protein n=1 Tax=Halobacillus mangrovi TaxID=402384 RepID=UPI003D97B7BD